MNIGILTYYGVHNHGAILQAYGLQLVLRKILNGGGGIVRFLSFERSYEYIDAEKTKKYKLGLNSVPFYFKYMLEQGIRNLFYNYKKHNTLKNFRNKYFDLNTSCYDFDGDLIIIGSDEVFSLEIGYNPMMYGYGLKAKRIISYAASFGPTTIQEIEQKAKKQEIQHGLERFEALSVRDYNSYSIVKNLLSKEVPIVCDPVILYGYESEIKGFTPPEQGYIAIYAYGSRMNNPAEVQAILAYARKHKLKVYSVGYYHEWCDTNIAVSPLELFSWFRNSEMVITDTFHGAVISMICNVPFAVKLRDNANKLAYLLSEYNLSHRIIETFDELGQLMPIDFNEVNNRLKEKREASIQYLRAVIYERT